MKYFILLLILALTLTGCARSEDNAVSGGDEQKIIENNDRTEEDGDGKTQTDSDPVDPSDMFTDRDLNTDYSDAVKIELNGTSAKASSKTVKISEGSVTITEEEDYLISGSYEGILRIETDDKAKPHLILDSVSITSKDSAALYITGADKVTVTLKGENTLTSESFDNAEDSCDGAVFSRQDLSFNGEGTLSVSSKNGHGIVCKDDLVLAGGSYTVSSASHGIDANDSVRVKDISLTVDSGKDGIHTENTEDTSKGFVYIESGEINIESEGDGISASAYMHIKDMTLDITAGGGAENGTSQSSGGWGGYMGGYGYYGGNASEDSESMKGLKAAGELILDGGEMTVDSADDAVHSNISVTVNEGSYTLRSGDDGIHADESLVINGGKVSIGESYEGLEAYEVTVKNGDISIYASDDGINAAGGTDQSGYGGRDNGGFGGFGGMPGDNGGVISIEGGKLYINAAGDGVDSNGELYVKGGDTVVSGPTYGDTSIIDYATEALISGGSFRGTGSVGMEGCFDSTSTQGAMMVSVSGEAGTSIILSDSEGNLILDHTPDQAFNCIILSHSDIRKGETYTLTVGTESYDIEMTDIIYSQGGGFGGHGGGGYGVPNFRW